MPHDMNGEPLQAGDRVECFGTIRSISPTETACNVTVELDAPEGEYAGVVTCNSKSFAKSAAITATTFVLALLLTAATAQADCPNGVCGLRPAAKVIAAPVVVVAKVAKAAVVVPAKVVKGCAHVVREVRPVRRCLRFCGRVVTGRGPVLSRMRANRCH